MSRGKWVNGSMHWSGDNGEVEMQIEHRSLHFCWRLVLGRGGIAIQIEHHSFFLEMGSEIEHRSLASLVWV